MSPKRRRGTEDRTIVPTPGANRDARGVQIAEARRLGVSRQRLSQIWKRQRGLCENCGNPRGDTGTIEHCRACAEKKNAGFRRRYAKGYRAPVLVPPPPPPPPAPPLDMSGLFYSKRRRV